MTARSKAATEAAPPEHIGRLLLRAQRSFGARFVAGLEALGHPSFTMAHLSIFPSIEPDGTRASVLADRIGMSKQSVAQLLSELEADGYIQRERDTQDARAAVVRMTRRGEACYRDAKKVKRDIEREYERRLGEAGLAELRRALALLIED
jgi:DNA-binding MarR family transcriptional regulator